MRFRNVLATAAAATLLACVTAAPASAGTGSSTWCSDGAGYREISLLSSPVTVGIQVSDTPGSPYQKVYVCYSTSAVHQPAYVTSGVIGVEFSTVTSVAAPSAYVAIACYPDFTTGAGPACSLPNSLDTAPADAVVSTPPSSICLVSLGTGCVAYVPGIKVELGQDPRPLLAIRLLGVPAVVDPAPQCIAVVVTCP